jgi:2,3-bisphosphoglycerate-independent phosphoglycerate mutase
VVTLTEYEAGLPVAVAFPPEEARSLAQVFSEAGWRQFHVAETEKYAHVTYFFNGGVEPPYPAEERLLVPSPRVATYDLEPAMSAVGVCAIADAERAAKRNAAGAHPKYEENCRVFKVLLSRLKCLCGWWSQ